MKEGKEGKVKNDVLEYIGLDLDSIPKGMLKQNSIHFSGYNNPKTYRVYEYISVKDLEILITTLDRTAELKDRYKMSKPLSEYLKKDNKKDYNNFLDVLESSSVEEIKNLEELQKKLNKDLPYFIKYNKNYLWQIYYSEEDKKYFMLFPTNEGETSVLFYIIKKKLEEKDTKIFVPISKKDYNGDILSSGEISDIENYIWLFTNEWPNIYEVCKDKLYITGKTKIKGIFDSYYRNIYETKESAKNFYMLLKALFILTTETNYKYTFNPSVNSVGELELKYENNIVNLKNLSKFVDNQNELQRKRLLELNQEIEKNEKNLDDLKEYVKKQNEVYLMQEKQIVMFLQCKKSFFKKITYYFKSKKFVVPKIEKEPKEDIDIGNIEIETTGSYTIKELVNITMEVNNIESKARDLRQDLRALKLKKENLARKIKNASSYIEEIEKHKKSIFEFWKFTNKDAIPALDIGEMQEGKIKTAFNFKEDLEMLGVKADGLQRQKLSVDECKAIYTIQECLEAINHIEDDDILNQVLEKIKEKVNDDNSLKDILGDYTSTKTLNNREHRENSRDILKVLKINKDTTLDEFKETLQRYKRLLKEAYNKIKSITDLTVYIEEFNKNNEYIIGEINPEKILEKNDKDLTIYKIKLEENTNILYFSNIIFFENNNQTLPLGMNVSTKVLIKSNQINKSNFNKEKINILTKLDDFNYKIKSINMLEEGLK